MLVGGYACPLWVVLCAFKPFCLSNRYYYNVFTPHKFPPSIEQLIFTIKLDLVTLGPQEIVKFTKQNSFKSTELTKSVAVL